MRGHNICFHREIKIIFQLLQFPSYLEPGYISTPLCFFFSSAIFTKENVVYGDLQ